MPILRSLRRAGLVGALIVSALPAIATAFRLNGGVGISFTFGSIYNSIVNPRLDELGN